MLNQCAVTTTIRCGDVNKLAGWYSDVLGLRIAERLQTGEVVLEAGSGTKLNLYPGPRSKADHTLACFTVANLEDEIRSLESKGVKFEDYDLPELKTVKHISTSPIGKCAWFRDPEGNYLGLTQFNKR